MRYTLTIEFEASTEDLAILTAQNAAQTIVYSDGVKFLRAEHSEDLSPNPNVETLRMLQELRPEDFSVQHVQEEVAAYNTLLAKGARQIVRRIVRRMYATPYRVAEAEFGKSGMGIVLDSISALEAVDFTLFEAEEA